MLTGCMQKQTPSAQLSKSVEVRQENSEHPGDFFGHSQQSQTPARNTTPFPTCLGFSTQGFGVKGCGGRDPGRARHPGIDDA